MFTETQNNRLSKNGPGILNPDLGSVEPRSRVSASVFSVHSVQLSNVLLQFYFVVTLEFLFFYAKAVSVE